MKHIFSIMADNIFDDRNGMVTYVQEFGNIDGGGLPITHLRLMVATKYELEEDDKEKNHTHYTCIVDPSGKQVNEIKIEADGQTMLKFHTFVARFYGPVFEVEGNYSIETGFIIDGKYLKKNTLPLQVSVK